MRVGILVPSIGNFGNKGFYNLQEIGLAKALDTYCEKVRVWRLTAKTEEEILEDVKGCKNTIITFLPSKQIGTNGFVDFSELDKNIDVLICFSDTQLAIPSIYKWCLNNGIRFIPYIGVIESHSTNKFKQVFIDIIFRRNLNVYKNSCCLVKTPTVGNKLINHGVKNITITPVGLDKDLLFNEYASYDIEKLKNEFGYSAENKVILFIGRLIEEKQPLRMIEIFSDITKLDDGYRLLMVGNGELKSNVITAIDTFKIKNKVQLIDQIPNSEVWKLYRMSDVFVNLNQQEIFGMAILEAMYYACKVVAWKAPGPSLIVENGKSGWIVESNQETIEKIKDVTYLGDEAHNRVINKFMWDSTAKEICSLL
jgi:1,2-diacylglycerol 3-alpha-glucosyltransferase